MSATIVTQSRAAGNGFTAANTFLPFLTANVSTSGTEANRQTPVRSAGIISRLLVRVTANTSGGDCTVLIRKGGADGAMLITIPAGNTGVFEDTTNSESVSPGDLVCFCVRVTGGGTVTMTLVSALFAASAGTVCMLGHAGPTDITDASTTRFWGFGTMPNGGLAAEVDAQQRIPFACTMRHLFVRVNTNARTTDVVFRSRKGGAFGNLTITVGAGLTGTFEDTSNSDTVAADDLYNFSFTTNAGTEIMNVVVCRVECHSTSGQWLFTAAASSGWLSSTGATEFGSGTGGDGQNIATEANVRQKARTSFALSKLRVYVSDSGTTGTSTVTIRVGGSSSALGASIGAAGVGAFTDDSDTVQITDASELNFQAVNGGGGNFTIRGMTLLATSGERTLKPPSGWIGQWPTVVRTGRR